MRIGDPDDPAVVAARERIAQRIPPGERDNMADSFAVGSPDAVIDLLRQFVDAGMSKFVMIPLVGNAEELMAQTRMLVEQLAPAIEDRVAA